MPNYSKEYKDSTDAAIPEVAKELVDSKNYEIDVFRRKMLKALDDVLVELEQDMLATEGTPLYYGYFASRDAIFALRRNLEAID